MNRVSQLAYTAAPQLQLPDYYNVSNLRAGSSWIVSNSHSRQKINSVFGFGKFSYNDYLFLEFSGRNDLPSLKLVPTNEKDIDAVIGRGVFFDPVADVLPGEDGTGAAAFDEAPDALFEPGDIVTGAG